MADWNGSYGQVDLDKNQDNLYPIMKKEWTGKNGLDWREARLDPETRNMKHRRQKSFRIVQIFKM